MTIVPAVERALNILEYLGRQGRPTTLKEVSSALGIPSTSTFRLVKYLCERGYVREEGSPQGGEYALGIGILRLAQVLKDRLDLRTVSNQIMQRLAEESGQTAQLGILIHGYGVTYLAQVQPLEPVVIVAPLGTVLPVNVSASGKLLVAYLPREARERFLERAKLEPYTPRSITDRNDFREELGRVRELGYAVDQEEFARGVGCLAAPIFDLTGAAVAAVGITGHIAEYHGKGRLAHLRKLVMGAAREISDRLTCSADEGTAT